MQLVFVLIFVLSLAAFAGWIWLVVSGFRRSALWGVLNLLLAPVSVVIYAVKYWDEASKPFLLYMGSSVAGVLLAMIVVPLMVGQAAAEISAELDRELERHAAEAQAAAVELEPSAPVGPGEPADAASLSVEADDAAPTAAETLAAVLLEEATPAAREAGGYEFLAEPAPSGFRSIRVRDASRFLGDYVRFVDRKGGEHDGRLKAVEGDTIVFERHLTAGTFVFEYRRNEIANLYVAY